MSEHKLNIDDMERLFSNRRKFERFAMLYVHDAAEAQDILMESFAYMWEHRSSIDSGERLEAYLFNVIKHKCLDWLEHSNVRRNAESNILSDAQWELEMSITTLRAFDPSWLYNDDILARIRAAVAELPQTTRRIFILSRSKGLTYAQIAQQLGISVKTVEFHISKALRILRSALGDIFAVLLVLLAINQF